MRFFGTNLLLLDENDLDVAGGAHVRVDAAVSTVRATPHVGSAVHLQVEHLGQNFETILGIQSPFFDEFCAKMYHYHRYLSKFVQKARLSHCREGHDKLRNPYQYLTIADSNRV